MKYYVFNETAEVMGHEANKKVRRDLAYLNSVSKSATDFTEDDPCGVFEEVNDEAAKNAFHRDYCTTRSALFAEGAYHYDEYTLYHADDVEAFLQAYDRFVADGMEGDIPEVPSYLDFSHVEEALEIYRAFKQAGEEGSGVINFGACFHKNEDGLIEFDDGDTYRSAADFIFQNWG